MTGSRKIRHFKPANQTWWKKPLVQYADGAIPAELAMLRAELSAGEQGVWINSRGTQTGVVDLIPTRASGGPSFATRRERLPQFISETLRDIYRKSGLSKGCPDLVIWDLKTQGIRFVEVKWRNRDRTSIEQEAFLKAAKTRGLLTVIAEWDFR